jgi:hypothetical protein
MKMARQLRIQFEGALYHIISRGNERMMIFLDEADRELLGVGAGIVREGLLAPGGCDPRGRVKGERLRGTT